jgi:hypothetical protein
VDRLGTWRRALLEGTDGSMSLPALEARLAEVDRRLDRTRTEHSGAAEAPAPDPPAPEPPAPEPPAPEPLRHGRSTPTERQAEATGALAAEQAMIDDDLEVTQEQLAAAQAEERRLTEELTALSARPAPMGPGGGQMDERAAIDAVREALHRHREAEEAVEAAGDTASVLRWGLERSAAAGRPWLSWIQPAALAIASGLVLVAVVLLTQGVNEAGIIVAALALASAIIALVLPARPLGVGPDVERMRLRLERAEEDSRRWADEARARSAHLAGCAAAAGLPDAVTDALLQRREAELAAGLDVREAIAAREQQREVARNTMVAARERVESLRAQHRDVQRRAEEREATSTTQQPVPPRSEAAAGGSDDSQDGAELRQERRGLAEELNRRRWELDRLTVARWLLSGAAADDPAITDPVGTASTAGTAGSAGTDGRLPVARRLVAEVATSTRSSPDEPLPVLVRGLETWPEGAERAELVRLLTELSRSAQILILTPRVEQPTEPAIRVLVTPAE